MVVVFEDQVTPNLARSVLKNRWDVKDGRKGKALVREIMLAHPKALILQIPEPAGVAEALLSRLSQHWTPMVLMAVGGERTDGREAAVRQAGADCFLPSTTAAETIEATVDAMSGKELRGL